MTTDYRAELQRLVKANDDGDVEAFGHAVERARTALTQPEPEGPTVMEIIELADEIEAEELGQVDLVRRALARWGHLAIQPVSLSERLPGPKDCDEEGRCWYFFVDSVIGGCGWQMFNEEENEQLETSYFWLPHYALPVPTTETP